MVNRTFRTVLIIVRSVVFINNMKGDKMKVELTKEEARIIYDALYDARHKLLKYKETELAQGLAKIMNLFEH